MPVRCSLVLLVSVLKGLSTRHALIKQPPPPSPRDPTSPGSGPTPGPSADRGGGGGNNNGNTGGSPAHVPGGFLSQIFGFTSGGNGGGSNRTGSPQEQNTGRRAPGPPGGWSPSDLD